MSRVAVVTSHPLFAEGGHLVIAQSLVSVLRERGHEAALVLTPQNRFGRQAAAYAATWLTDVGVGHDGGPVDQVISFRYPSYAVRHPRHVCWLNHRMREYYDRWPAFAQHLSWRARAKERVRRRLIHGVDRYLLTRNVTRVVAQSRTIRDRLQRWGGITASVVHPPPPPRAYRCDEHGDFILVVSRLTPLKRVDLVIDALCEPAAAGVRVVVIGDGEEAGTLRARVQATGLEERVRFLGAVGDDELLGQLARCRAVCFPASAEDYGLVTAEAFASGKAVVTCSDSGGPTELVTDGVTGLVVAPAPGALADGLGRLMQDRALAERLGRGARRAADALRWEEALRALLLHG